MKKWIYCTLVVPMVFACSAESSDNNTASTTANNSDTETTTVATASGQPIRKDACEITDAQDILNILKWEDTGVTESQMMDLEKYDVTVCHYYNKTGQSVQSRVAWKEGRAVENKLLEKEFKRLVEEGDKYYTYEDATNDIGTASIYGHRADRGYFYYYLATRFENDVMLSVEITETKEMTEGVMKKLKALQKLYM